MIAAALPQAQFRAVVLSPALTAALVIALFAIALRLHGVGNPTVGLDEQFYLLVGERMLDGAVPYVDIWDRKPVGLFLIYATIAALPGDGVLAYQLVATASLAATGMVAAAIARRLAPAPAALAAGLAVVAWGVLLGGGFGEAPVFYDLLVGLAVWLLLGPRRDRLGARVLAMLLAGVAITIKTTALFEGCALGLLLLVLDRHLAPGKRCRRGVVYVTAGAAPTLAIAGCYAAAGHFESWWFANAVSILGKTGGWSRDSVAGLVACLIMLAPLVLLAPRGWRVTPTREQGVMGAWLAGTAAGFAAIGFFHFHYALPLTVPLAVLAAAGLRHPIAQGVALASAALIAAVTLTAGDGQRSRDRADLATLTALVPAEVPKNGLFVHEGPTILYLTTSAALPGRYIFPGHFTDPAERDALERPAPELLRETLARRPAAIVTAARDGPPTETDRILRAELVRAYRLAGTQSIRLYGAHRVLAEVWVRPARPTRRPQGGSADRMVLNASGVIIRR